jgi:predicted glutamine amidotransferase
MCGIFGYIGIPKDHKATFALTNALMVKTEPRGIDATGFWACLQSQKKIFYHKEPVKSSLFCERPIWKDSGRQKIDLLLGHCRFTSPGVGGEEINKNNHPHVSKDFRIALVHNGKIPEYQYLKKHYTVNTDCDSEVLLRIFESGEGYRQQQEFLKSQLEKAHNTSLSTLYRVYGLKQIFSEVNYGAMAVAIGEHLDDGRALWLFHNPARPLCLVDLRETMGQFFFCSTPEIFRAAVNASELPKDIIPLDQEVMKLPPDLVYHFKLKEDGAIDWEMFRVNRTRKYGYWENNQQETEKESPKSDKESRLPVEVVTHLDDQERVIESNMTRLKTGVIFEDNKVRPFIGPKPNTPVSFSRTVYEEDDDEVDESNRIAQDSEGIVQICCKGIELLRSISVEAHNSIIEGSMTESDANELLEALSSTVIDLEGLKYTIR